MKKMKKLCIALASAALFSAGNASAEGHDWSGWYAGGALGINNFVTDTSDYWCWYACDAPGNSEMLATATLGGGYNWQHGSSFVTGIELDVSSGLESSERIAWSGGTDGVNWESSWDYLITLRGRAGLAVDKTLIYITGGLAAAQGDYSAQEFGDSDNNFAKTDGMQIGMVAGAGIEHALSNNLQLKMEYLTMSMPKEDQCWADSGGSECAAGDNDDAVHWKTSNTVFRIGANWSF